ncbi:MAG TPA: phosphatidylserine decarboxylase family protein [Prolixibacteraceae bacterium]|nr:phosphatidylserine decarboxylase family protein [Prolixibacteraceae bacterium]
MRIHKEGRLTLLLLAISIVIINYAVIKIFRNEYTVYITATISILLYLLVMYFFRFVNRPSINDENAIIAPCDGKVVVIEESYEGEFLKCETLKVSIFMSPLNVHMNWFPVGGKILLSKIHRGKHLVAYAPKSSDENERSSVVIETPGGKTIMVRQIAGAMARRVVCYAKEDGYAEQNGHLGFIKFGSRVDMYLPIDTKIKVELNQNVIGTQTVIARFK